MRATAGKGETGKRVIQTFEDLIVWQKGIALVKSIYHLSNCITKQSDISTCRVFAPRHFPLTLPSPPCSGERVVEDWVRGRCAIGPVMRLMSLCIATVTCLCIPPILTAGPDRSQARVHANRGFEFAQKGDLKEAEAELRRATELAPDDPQYLAGLGSILGMQQKLTESEVYFKKVLKLDPRNLAVRRDLAATQWQLGELEDAKANLETVLKTKPGNAPAMLLLGMVLENLKEYTAAAKLLASVPDLVRQRPESLAALARCYYKTGQNTEARATLQTLQNHPAGPPAVFMGGRVATEAEDYEMAEGLFMSIKSSYTDTVALAYNLALVQYRSGRFRASQDTLLDLINAGHRRSEIYNLLGWCYQRQDNQKEAIRALEQAIDRDPSREGNYLDLGMILASHRRLPAALAVANEAVKANPHSYHSHLMKGLTELRMDQYTDAVKSYSRALELDPSNAEANRGLAVAQFAAGMNREALATFERGLSQFPRDAATYQEYGKVLIKLSETGDTTAESRAAELLTSALALDGSLSEPHYYLGNLALKKGKLTEAAQHLEKAAALDQKSSKIPYALARAYRRLGRTGDSTKELQRYHELKAEEEKAVPGFSAIVQRVGHSFASLSSEEFPMPPVAAPPRMKMPLGRLFVAAEVTRRIHIQSVFHRLTSVATQAIFRGATIMPLGPAHPGG